MPSDYIKSIEMRIRYLIIFDRGERHEVVVRDWMEFIDQLNRLTQRYGPPDLIYKISI
jgi:hypothetical protein